MKSDLKASSQDRDRERFTWNGRYVEPGETCDLQIAVSESYSGVAVEIPIQIQRATTSGPTVFVSAALHGDEINGTGAVRELLKDDEHSLLSGTLILVPVLNIPGFERHSRYLPDRRDLNRAFPGSSSGTLAGRMAQEIFKTIVQRSDFGIDIHTASKRRTNYPNVRGDLAIPEVKRMALAFGCEVVMNGPGPVGAMRREACKAGCPTIIMEGGEVSKVEPSIVESAIRGVRNVLREFGMLGGDKDIPDYQLVIEKSKWIRADHGGFLSFHVKPGDVVAKGQALATNATLLGQEQSAIFAPFDGVVVGMTTLPAISPGDPICNLGALPKGTKPSEFRRRRRIEDGLETRLVDELASNVLVVKPEE